MVENIVNDDLGRWILKQHEEARCEYPLTQTLKGTYRSRTIDRTFVDENGVRWVIDYKTGEHLGANLENFFNEETERYRPQLDQYAAFIKENGETRPIKKALYYPMHRKLIVVN
jgi:ATP-dependent exoDNAse (exonuclease V) beta subunit